LTTDESRGLAALLNSSLIDRYFRIINGNTQINAVELRSLPLPELEVIQDIGRKLGSSENGVQEAEFVVFSTLWETGCLSEDFPILKETRIKMGKIEEVQGILEILGLPAQQQNEISALTFLALAQLSEDTPWEEARTLSMRVHDILLEIKNRYGREYAENTRETIRRQVLHQFEQAGLIFRNPDEPTLATNSPRTHYILTPDVVDLLRKYNSRQWPQSIQEFLNNQGTLLKIYQQARDQNKVPLHLADGTEYRLSPGKHNQLQVDIVQEFGPRFAPGAELLYLGDTASKDLIIEKGIFQELGVLLPKHGKLPDVVLYDVNRNRLFLFEAVTSHGPVSPKRRTELEEIFNPSPAIRIYVTAFPDLSTFKKFISMIAWETEVWIAEIPGHLIHYNGDHFLGPNR
jgi:adenine-specific DNA-methyltransferase